MATPEAGVAFARKFTGEVTVAPFTGAQTTTPGDEGAEHGGAVVPVPESEAEWGLPAAESVMVMLPARVPGPLRVPVWVGASLTVMLQLAPPANVEGQLLFCAKSPLGMTLLTVRVEPPLLVKVTDCDELVVPTVWLLKVKLEGIRVT